MKDGLKVSMCQIDIVSLDIDQNRRNIEEAFRKACETEEKPDLLVFPELSNTGYVFQRSREFGNDYMRAAEIIPEGPTSQMVSELCREFGVYCVIGLCEAHRDIPALIYNTAAFFGPDGELIGR